MTVKALKKQLMAAIAMVVVSAIALSSSTYAWFAANREVTATNMTIKATSDSSLIISRAAPTASTTTITEDFVATAVALTPATHDSTWATYANGLKAIDTTTKSRVNAGTGLATEYTYETTTLNTHYLDFVVYISTAGATALTNQDISVVITNTTTGDTRLAGSIDFYAETLTSSSTASSFGDTTFKGTLNLAGKDAATNNGTATKTTLKVLDNGTIPLNSSEDSFLRITMRVYFDGALLKEAGQAYVYSNLVTTEDLGINVKFTATDHSNS